MSVGHVCIELLLANATGDDWHEGDSLCLELLSPLGSLLFEAVLNHTLALFFSTQRAKHLRNIDLSL